MKTAPRLYCSIRNVSIPQAVSTVATYVSFFDGISSDNVSIPQAVSTVATIYDPLKERVWVIEVSIPQAVSTVATVHI